MRHPNKKFVNPFYSLLLIAGIVFVVTATAYGVMAFRERGVPSVTAAETASAASIEHPLMTWMSQHGETALMTELAFLAVFTFAAIATDDYWQRRTNAEKKLQTANER